VLLVGELLGVEVLVDLYCVIVQVSFQLAKVANFLLVIVSLTHTRVSF
jgi:hypothetical protein